MTSAGGGYGDDGGPWRYEPREPGARRRKLAGYLKAANELRQTYQQSYMQSWNNEYGMEDRDPMPGSFPSTKSGATVRSGEEEMILFPSYARKHVKQKPSAVPGTIQEAAGSGRDIRDTAGTGDAEYWRTQWEQYEDDNAIVDVDVRGWVYTPHKGPLNRKNRLFVGLARQMVGIPAPASSPTNSASSSRSTSPHPIRRKMEAHNAKHEEQLVALEAESLMRQGEAEADAAHKGAYSEGPTRDANTLHMKKRDDSPTYSDDSQMNIADRRQSWNAPAQMSQAELSEANSRLMTRLKPFLANPTGYTPISAFFYNDTNSRQKTIDTDAYGHFNLRAALDFVPTHVRILASEGLSATEEVHVTESNGVSVISDIDDTVKHSAIASGAREIFRNVFIRDLGDLSINGVKDWYTRLADKGASFHYVSNSPWQLYPVLTSFFSLAGLPKGSFHLKLYSGMFQGIFEPVAERKKGTLERIMRDFPERRFILIGDSGEADLEVYTDIVLENPGRILGVFIRDVTTSQKTRFFNSSMKSSASDPSLRPPNPPRNGSDGQRTPTSEKASNDDDAALEAGIAASLKDFEKSTATNGQADMTNRDEKEEDRPLLPARRRTEPAPVEEDLIDFASGDEKDVPIIGNNKDSAEDTLKAPPLRPPKPRGLSSASVNETARLTIPRKPAPAPPRRPSTSVHPKVTSNSDKADLKASADDSSDFIGAEAKTKPPRPRPPPQRLSYGLAERLKPSVANPSPLSKRVSSADVPRSQQARPSPNDPRSQGLSKTISQAPSSNSTKTHASENQPPPLPARKPVLSYPAAAAQYATSLYNAATSGSSTSLPSQRSSSTRSTAAAHSSSDGTSTPSNLNLVHPNSYPLDLSSGGQNAPAQANKKEELWKRRWARAEAILRSKGVVLKSWRVGGDVSDDVVRLLEKAQKETGVASERG